MIESVRFQNFKALQNTTLPLGPFTLIVGPNGSGKSTALQALIGASRGGLSFASIVTANLAISDSTRVMVVLQWSAPHTNVLTEGVWRRNGTFHREHKHFKTGATIHDNAGVGQFLTKQLAAIRVYSLEARAIARAAELRPNEKLQEDGSRLAGVLDRLRDSIPERFETLNAELGRCLPEFDRILFATPAPGERSFSLRMREGQHSIPAVELSQGTLLALAILTLAYLPDPPPMVCFEEPDRGIHPRLLRDVRDALYRLSYPQHFGESRDPVQVIATTHSPYFLDLFKDHPEEIVIAQKVGPEARFERLSDREDLAEILRDAHLGDVWYSGILGGVPCQQ